MDVKENNINNLHQNYHKTKMEDPLEGTMGDTPGSQTVSMKLQRIAQQAANYPEMVSSEE